jgi:hypothetical protein
MGCSWRRERIGKLSGDINVLRCALARLFGIVLFLARPVQTLAEFILPEQNGWYSVPGGKYG